MKRIYKQLGLFMVCTTLVTSSFVDRQAESVDARWTGWSYHPGWIAGGSGAIASACQTLKMEGLTSSAAAGVIGNFMAESGMNPYKREAVGNHDLYGKEFADRLDPDNDSFGPGRGLAQWGDGSGLNNLGGSRWVTLVNYVNTRYGKSYPVRPSSAWNNNGDSNQTTVQSQWPKLEEQLTFVKKELIDGNQGLTLSEYNSVSSPEDAAYMFAARYERPSAKALADSLATRKSEARKAYDQYCKLDVVPSLNYQYNISDTVQMHVNQLQTADLKSYSTAYLGTKGVIKERKAIKYSDGNYYPAYRVEYVDGMWYWFWETDLIKTVNDPVYSIGNDVKQVASDRQYTADGKLYSKAYVGMKGVVKERKMFAHTDGFTYPAYRVEYKDGTWYWFWESDIRLSQNDSAYFIGNKIKYVVPSRALTADNHSYANIYAGIQGVIKDTALITYSDGIAYRAYRIEYKDGTWYWFWESDIQMSQGDAVYTIGNVVKQVVPNRPYTADGKAYIKAYSNMRGVIKESRSFTHVDGISYPAHRVEYMDGTEYWFWDSDLQISQNDSIYAVGNTVKQVNSARQFTADNHPYVVAYVGTEGIIKDKAWIRHTDGQTYPAYRVEYVDGTWYWFWETDLQISRGGMKFSVGNSVAHMNGSRIFTADNKNYAQAYVGSRGTIKNRNTLTHIDGMNYPAYLVEYPDGNAYWFWGTDLQLK